MPGGRTYRSYASTRSIQVSVSASIHRPTSPGAARLPSSTSPASAGTWSRVDGRDVNDILIGKGEQQVRLLPKYGNRHGLIAGATGTGKTISLMVLAEGFSRLGVPVFMADVKGDVAGLAMPGVAGEKI